MNRRLALAIAAVVLLASGAVYCAWPLLQANGGQPKAVEHVRDSEAPPAAPKPPADKDGRPATWAEPISKPGLPNLHRVSEDLYRGAQPTAEGMRELKAMGIKAVVDLRALHSDRDEIGDLGLASENIPMQPWHAETEDVVRFLKIATDKSRTPVFVHCLHGSDRTGFICAAYRIVVCGWTKEEAIREMKEGGFGYHSIFRNLLRHIEELDVEAIKKEAGLAK